ncbi:MAG: amidohydrolase [Thermoplasmatota archaeon]
MYHGFTVENGEIGNIDNYDKIMEGTDEKIDLDGNYVLPGFIDSHTHLLETGLKMDRVDLSECETFEEVKYYLKKKIDDTEEGDWVIGVDYDESKWKDKDVPNKDNLDDLSKDHPIIIKRVCGHTAIANTVALENISYEGEEIDYESGILKEQPVWELDEIIPISKKDRKEAIKKGIEKAHSLGITCVHEIVGKDSWPAYKELEEEEGLDLRFRCYIYYDEVEEDEPVEISDFLSLKGLKVFADGSIGARTAALEEDYTDDPGNKGILIHDQEEIEKIIKNGEEKGFQIMIHAIGDRAISTAINAFEESSTKASELRHRIEHAEMLWEENIRRIRDLNLILSVQPNFAYKWSKPGGMNHARLGKKRLQNCNPYWDIQRSLVKMTFGSDCMPMDPLFGIYSAVNHPLLEQRISTYNALQSYITNGAYAGKDENKFGKFKEGMSADFVVLSANPLESDSIKDIEVVMTVVDGEIVYDNRN